ncbi:MAG: SPOR domain-containing protein [Alphaproteobacteria bacterium]|nr:SPOR domain-containing protein [Alphaproteobacteria bacterium]MBV9370964.1 SPOR domain-containing protein [Alphaproteobacteria bacterium]MBV9899507.1 SPOR domain-containing protein [Alphaproteobacteria bacterium]
MRISGRQMIAGVAAAAFMLAAGSAMADTKKGYDAWMARDYPGAVAEWRPLADKGDADAQFDLGQAYKLGRGVPQDMRIAQSWFEKAAQQGHIQAQTMLGLILFQNGERERALPWIRRGAEAGDPRAQYVLGTAMFNGDLVQKDWVRAYALMSRAAAQGLPPAATNLQAMDQYIPLAQRQQGLALARQMEKGAQPTRVASAQPTPPRPNGAIQSTLPAPAPVRAAPAPVRAAPAPAAAAGGGWRVQLGAFGSPANARRAWDGLRARGGAFAGLQPVFAQAGAVTRLQAGPLPGRAAADRVCAAAKAAGSACFPVAP